MADQNTYFDQMAPALNGYPTGAGDLDTLQARNLLNTGNFNDAMKQRILQAMQQAYLRQGTARMSPIERFGQGTASQLATTDTDYK